jgi:AcrR family transcriptional regulator
MLFVYAEGVPMSRRTNQERTRTTRRALISAARRRFEAHGYAGTNLDDIAELAGVTKGALYHHFPTKKALYEAVVVDIHDELGAHSDGRANKADNVWDRFVEAFVAFLEITPEPGIRMLMVEAPAVLGYQRWHEIDDEHNLPGIIELLEDLQTTGELVFDATPEFARVLNAMINALGTLVSEDDDPATARTIVIPIWEHLLRSLKAPGPRDHGRRGTTSSPHGASPS